MAHRSVAHLDQYGAAHLDSRTLVILREDILVSDRQHDEITAEIDAGFRDEWDHTFADDVAARATAVDRITTELAGRP